MHSKQLGQFVCTNFRVIILVFIAEVLKLNRLKFRTLNTFGVTQFLRTLDELEILAVCLVIEYE
jgi:hypothetical protein